MHRMQVEISKKFQFVIEADDDFSIKDAYHRKVFYTFLFDPDGGLFSMFSGESSCGESADV